MRSALQFDKPQTNSEVVYKFVILPLKPHLFLRKLIFFIVFHFLFRAAVATAVAAAVATAVASAESAAA